HEARLGLEVTQVDAAIELFLRLFSRAGLERVHHELAQRAGDTDEPLPPSLAHFLAHAEAYEGTVDAVVRFLQGRDPGLALRIVGRDFLPEGPRFASIVASVGSADARSTAEGGAEVDEGDEDPLGWAFGGLGSADRAKHLASLYIDDVADAIREGISPEFE